MSHDMEVAFFLRGAHGVSGLWPSPPAITQPHHVTSVDRCSCCRQTNHSTFGLVSLLCPSLRSLWTLISTLGPLHRTPENPYPCSRVRVSRGTGTGGVAAVS